MNVKTASLYLFLSLLLGSFFSCQDDEMAANNDCAEPVFANNILVLHEGVFQGTGSVSLINIEGNCVVNKAFQEANNGKILGSLSESVHQGDNRLYFSVTDGAKIVITEEESLEVISEITDVQKPRYFIKASNGFGYVSQWGLTNNVGQIGVIDLSTNQITQNITVGKGPDQLIEHEGKLYVANQGGYDLGLGDDIGDSTVMVINMATNEVEKTLVVGRNPNSFTVDANNDLWVAYNGFSPNFTETHPDFVPGGLTRIVDEEVMETIELDRLGVGRLTTDRDQTDLFFINGGLGTGNVFKMNIITKEVTLFVPIPAYGLGINPANNQVYISDAQNFTPSGIVHELDINSNSLNTFDVGIAPNSFLFK